MRIISGIARGIRLEVAAGSATRPFLEMARGALFNSLGSRIEGAKILDLYAGSGALGLESLSRGAAECVFVEYDRRAVATLRGNIDKCKLSGLSRVVQADVGGFLSGAAGRGEGGLYDVIFIDPPFAELSEWSLGGGAEASMRDAANLLTGDGTLVFRFEEGKAPPPEWPGLVLDKDKRYGRSRVCRYVWSGSGEA